MLVRRGREWDEWEGGEGTCIKTCMKNIEQVDFQYWFFFHSSIGLCGYSSEAALDAALLVLITVLQFLVAANSAEPENPLLCAHFSLIS